MFGCLQMSQCLKDSIVHLIPCMISCVCQGPWCWTKDSTSAGREVWYWESHVHIEPHNIQLSLWNQRARHACVCVGPPKMLRVCPVTTQQSWLNGLPTPRKLESVLWSLWVLLSQRKTPSKLEARFFQKYDTKTCVIISHMWLLSTELQVSLDILAVYKGMLCHKVPKIITWQIFANHYSLEASIDGSL